MIVLDTHAWLWWHSDPERLSPLAREAIDRSATLGVCPTSCWELAMLVVRERIELDRDVMTWVRQALAHPRATLCPLTSEIAVDAALLDREGFPPDPADRIIYATARANGARLVSADQRLRKLDPARLVW